MRLRLSFYHYSTLQWGSTFPNTVHKVVLSFYNITFNTWVCIYPTPPSQAVCNTRSIFKWSTAGFNAEFFLLKAKEPSLLYYLAIVEKKNRRVHVFLKGIRFGARGVMVIVIRNGHGDLSSNPGRDWLHFT